MRNKKEPATKTRYPFRTKPTKPRAKKVDTFLPFSIIEGEGFKEIFIGVKTVTEANGWEHWTKRHARHKSQAAHVRAALSWITSPIPLPVSVTITRYAPYELDDMDNLPVSQKYVFDAICDFLIPGLNPGRADRDKRIKGKCEQVKSKAYGVKILFEYNPLS